MFVQINGRRIPASTLLPSCSWMPCSLKRSFPNLSYTNPTRAGLDEERVMRLVEKRFGAERKNIDCESKPEVPGFQTHSYKLNCTLFSVSLIQFYIIIP